MYHCQICFYMITGQNELFATLKQIPPLPHFTHEYLQSTELDAALTDRADVILADVRQMNMEEALAFLLSHKRKEAELILLADKEQTELLAAKEDTDITDIWVMPLSEAELKFRLIRWQKTYKMGKDFWQTQNYLDSTINCVPHLIWYK
ncbi:MAG: hybrid sensor histidine kinase/response regulator, partial [Lachnospiraceae bacterium]|nr:hybrid sensor histidine kinase/response regulator [Lachnospiraceae bacterium]